MEIFHIPGLYPYAYSRWGLKAPAYSTLPVHAMTRIAATEEADGICDEADAGGVEEQAVSSNEGGAHMRDHSHSTQDNQMEKDSPPQPHVPKLKCMSLHLKKSMITSTSSIFCANLTPPISLIRIRITCPDII
jgi:hypothetical protein